jgi:pyruvate ferredoxin oxidoreductase beta subunit
MHTQLGSSGSAALSASATLKALMRKGKMKNEPITFYGDGGGADMGVGAISATLTHPDYNCLIQLSGGTPCGAHTTFSPPGSQKRIMHRRWKKNTPTTSMWGRSTCLMVSRE